MAVIMKKKIDFGKIDFTGNGRKAYSCDVTIELRENGGEETFRYVNGKKEYTGETTPKYTELAICGEVWNTRHTDIVCGGQCLDEMLKHLRGNPKFVKIYNVWKNWHLNGMNAGTPEQEAKIREWKAEGHKYDYKEVCAMLMDCGLYEVEFTGKTVGRMYDHEPYMYGHGWVIKDLPDDVIEFVKGV